MGMLEEKMDCKVIDQRLATHPEGVAWWVILFTLKKNLASCQRSKENDIKKKRTNAAAAPLPADRGFKN